MLLTVSIGVSFSEFQVQLLRSESRDPCRVSLSVFSQHLGFHAPNVSSQNNLSIGFVKKIYNIAKVLKQC